MLPRMRDATVNPVDLRGMRAGPLNCKSQNAAWPMPDTGVAGGATPFYSNGLRYGAVI